MNRADPRHWGQRRESVDHWRKGDKLVKVASLADVKPRLSAYIEDLPTNGPVVITRNGRPAAVLIGPKDDQDLERLLLARSAQIQMILNESRRSLQAGQGLSPAEFWTKAKSHRKIGPKHAARSKTPRAVG